ERLILFGVVGLVLAFFLSSALVRMPESQTRSYVSRARADMRTLGIALDQYKAEHGGWPAMVPLVSRTTDEADLSTAGGAGLSTLAAGLNDALLDPLSPDRKTPFVWRSENNGWIMISAGPDRTYQIDPEKWSPSIRNPEQVLISATY